ncbi:22181_t:CDS:1 [Dentiscutata erythropus]|uniref:22181_t:CDS:1 n=1 Tax=Dentiscutata erythropus TaxID=1348616 RepID=A0A9N9EGG0_9GLOM|nr:22181_t:CDS:1 [Dentiscutata erythropus]
MDNNMDTIDLIDEVNNFITYIQSHLVFQRIFRLNINLYTQILQRTNNRKFITAYSLFKKRIIEEGYLINVTDGEIINLSANKIWRSLTPVEKSVFHTYATQIRSILDIRN